MSNYPNTVLTNAGLDLISESITEGKALIFTKVQLGDGAAPSSISAMTALVSPKMDISLTSGTASGGQAKLRFVVSNSSLTDGFFAREVGVFAKVGADGTEQLYAYTNGGNYVDYIPDASNPIDDQIMDVYIVTGNAANVTINVNSATYVTVADLEDHDEAYESHKDVYGLFLRQKSTTYAVGDVVYLPSLGAKLYFECTVAGTTSNTDLTITTPVVNELVTDGTVTWKIKQYAQELATKADRGLSNLTQGGEDHYLERDYTIIYPNGGTENSPATLTNKTRYVETNPFSGYAVSCILEGRLNGKWGRITFASYQDQAGSYISTGATVNQLDDNIVLQTGSDPNYFLSFSYWQGDPFGQSSIVLYTSIPVRVKVWKIGKAAS